MGESGIRGSSRWQACPAGRGSPSYGRRRRQFRTAAAPWMTRVPVEVIGTIDARAGQVNDFVRPGIKERGTDNE